MSDCEICTQTLALFFAFPFLKTLADECEQAHREVTIFLPDVVQSDLENGLEQFYLCGDTTALAAVLDAFVTNGQEHENTRHDNDLALEEDKCDEQGIDDFSDLCDKDQFEPEHEYTNYNDEFEDSTLSEFSNLITSTGVKKHQGSSIIEGSSAPFGHCFYSPIENEKLSRVQVTLNCFASKSVSYLTEFKLNKYGIKRKQKLYFQICSAHQ